MRKGLQLEYSYFLQTALLEFAALLGWIVYSTFFLSVWISLFGSCVFLVFILRNFLTWNECKSQVKSLSTPHTYAESYNDIYKSAIEDKKKITLGRGFVWENLHIQGYHDLLMLPERRKYIDLETAAGGYEFMHSLNSEDKKIKISKDELQHTVIAGTSGAGKTKLFEYILSQLIVHEPTIIIDPKGDKGLLDGVYDACVDHGIEDRFTYFSLAHPSESIGFNPLSNYGGPSDIADRIASIFPVGSGGEAFRNFTWQVIEIVSSALMGVQETITLEKLQRYSMEDMNELVDLCQERITKVPPKVRRYAERSLARLQKQADHPKEHYQKMITSLGPVLTSLNTGDISPLLNAEPQNSLNWRDVINKNQIVYFDLSSMLRGEVANNVGKMIIQDLLYFVGEIYAFMNISKNLNVFVDEFYSVMFSGYIDMLNKSRGAGMRMILGMQTTADIANALANGQDSYVRQVMGNIKNRIYLRVPEQNLAQEFSDLFGTTYITQYTEMHSEQSRAGSGNELYGSTIARRQERAEVNAVNPDMLMHLPIGQAFAFLEARDPYKLRLPLIDRPESKKNYFSKRIMQTDKQKFKIEDDEFSWAEFDDGQVIWPQRPRAN